MTETREYLGQEANSLLLQQEIIAALGWTADEVGVVVSRDDRPVRVHLLRDTITDAERTTVDNTVAAHDHTQLTLRQQAIARAATAPDRVEAIPGWALWTEQEALDYIDINVTDLASAKTVLKAMARLLVALRDAQWPGLGVE